MKSLSFLTLFMLLFSFTALAVKGTYAPKEFELPQTCKLTISVEVDGQVRQGICTASFVGKKTFTTAEHCEKAVTENLFLLESKKVTEAPYFQCPGSEKKYSVSPTTYPMKDTRYPEHQDIALLKVEEDIPNLKAMSIPTSGGHIAKLLEDPTKCYINGYGQDNENKSGTLHAAQVVEWDAKPAGFFGGSTEAFKLTKNYADHGDSGGPMYCFDGKNPVLVGVVHGGQNGGGFSTIEKFTKALDWINLVKDSEKPDVQKFNSILKIEDRCSAVDECFAKLNSTAKLSADMKKIFDKVFTNVKSIKNQMVKGENLEEKTIEEAWKSIDEEWKKNNCYNVLYPD